MALCWDSKPGRLEVVWVRVWARWETRARPMLCRSMSFSGFGGTGGAGRLVEDSEGIARVRGPSMRSGGGGSFTCGCG